MVEGEGKTALDSTQPYLEKKTCDQGIPVTDRGNGTESKKILVSVRYGQEKQEACRRQSRRRDKKTEKSIQNCDKRYQESIKKKIKKSHYR